MIGRIQNSILSGRVTKTRNEVTKRSNKNQQTEETYKLHTNNCILDYI